MIKALKNKHLSDLTSDQRKEYILHNVGAFPPWIYAQYLSDLKGFSSENQHVKDLGTIVDFYGDEDFTFVDYLPPEDS